MQMSKHLLLNYCVHECEELGCEGVRTHVGIKDSVDQSSASVSTSAAVVSTCPGFFSIRYFLLPSLRCANQSLNLS